MLLLIDISRESQRLLDELVRADLQGLRDSFFARLLVFTGIVALGVLLEEADALFDTKRLNPRHWATRSIKALVRIGWIMVLVGVIGEGAFEALVSQSDGFLQAFNDALVASTQREAAFANEQAEEVRKKNLVLEAANLELQKRLFAMAHREAVLRAASKRFAGLVKAFPGQNFEIRYCLLATADMDMGGLITAFQSLLSGWKLIHPAHGAMCITGIALVIASNASTSTKRAANALHTLLIEIDLETRDSTLIRAGSSVYWRNAEPIGPDTIVIVVGR